MLTFLGNIKWIPAKEFLTTGERWPALAGAAVGFRCHIGA
jgi:hypothetical protein